LISAPCKDDLKTTVYGLNHHLIRANYTDLSNASSTTNCLAPLAKTLHDAFGVTRSHMTTVYSYTGDQPAHYKAHKDSYRARAAALSMIPTTTGAAQALGKVLPDLNGVIAGTAIRVPTPNVSYVGLVVEVLHPVTVNQVNAALRTSANGPLAGVLGRSTAR
jgi:glyceraldehyde 3-phosphate dehydrogenase